MAGLPGSGGGGPAFRASHGLAVAAWKGTPTRTKLAIQTKLAQLMGWSIEKAIQQTKVFFSEISGEGGAGGGGSGDSGSGSNNSEPGSERGSDRVGQEERQKRFENFRRQIDPNDIKGAQPVEGSGTAGHARSKHGVSKEAQADILNNPERIFSGRNENEREVDIYYKDGSVVITEAGKKYSVITAYGKVSKKGKATPINPEKWANDPSYVEIKIDGPDQVIYPNAEQFKLRDWP